MSVIIFPYIAAEEDDFAVLYKPPDMHCAPQETQRTYVHNAQRPHVHNAQNSETLLDWFALRCPQVSSVKGKRAGEGGLVHRLDFHTQGLVLFAKNQKFFDLIQGEQNQGSFIKEYRALCLKETVLLPGFPPAPPITAAPCAIESCFRSFGQGRKAVRPVADTGYSFRPVASDRGQFYRTEITAMHQAPPAEAGGRAVYSLAIRIKRGFRHQIRCHLAWMGFPILNDPLYGIPPKAAETAPDAHLALCSCALTFIGSDLHTRNCCIPCRELENQ